MQQRYYALDVFRGATVALMILVNNPGSWEAIFTPLEHAAWHGCTPTDLVFPFFLFAVGNALAFVMPKMHQQGAAFFWQKTLKRVLLIFLIGLFLNWSPFVKWDNDVLIAKPWEKLRLMGVLQRIAICYGFAAFVVFYAKEKKAMYIGMLLLVVYWLACYALGTPSLEYTLKGFWGLKADAALLGNSHLYQGEGVPFDPEGLASTPAAIVEVLAGYGVGYFIKQHAPNDYLVSRLLLMALGLMLVGYWWDMVFPINKKIWTSSYTVYTSGLATATIGIMIYMTEIKGLKGKWSAFFDAFGKNPLFIFVLSGFLPRVLGLIRIPIIEDAATGEKGFVSPLGWMYHQICKPISSDLRVGSLLYALIMIAFYWLIAYWLNKKKIYIKV